MMYTCLKKTFNYLNIQQLHLFCTKKGTYNNKTFFKNGNLIFEDHQYKMSTYFFLPELKKIQQNGYEINKYSNVLSFVWQERGREVEKGSEDSNQKSNQTQQKQSFSFQFNELQTLLQVLPKSGLRATLERKRDTTHQYLTLVDNQLKKAIKLTLKNTGVKGKDDSQLHFEFAYSKHRIFQILLRKSLFELSGMSLIYQIKREQEVYITNESFKKKEQITKETSEFYK